MFEVPSRDDVVKVVITEGVVSEGRAPLMLTGKDADHGEADGRQERTA
jgi:ATP-dependent Clp protease ATP-binding subunit ClpX